MTAGKIGRGIGKGVKWAVLLGALIVIVLIIAMVFALGDAASESEESSRAIGPEKYEQIRTGMTEQRVRSIIGVEPESTSETEVAGTRMECWYYGVLASSASYQLCFDNGRLSTKSRL